MADEPKLTLSEEAGLYVMAALRDAVSHIERDIENGGKLLADPSKLPVAAREYFAKRQAEERKYIEEIKTLLKMVRYGKI